MIRFRPILSATAATLLALAILVGLGVWQLQRLEWKVALIAAAEERSSAPPLPLEAVDWAAPAETREYLRVTAHGRYEHAGEQFLFAGKAKAGETRYLVVTPFRLADGRVLLIERGLVSEGARAPEQRREGQIEGETEVTGLLRAGETAGALTPPPDRAARLWYHRDAAAMAEAIGEAEVLPVFLALDAGQAPGGLPAGGHTRLTFRNDHLSYALTWFALAAVLLGVYLAYHVAEGRLRLGGRGR